MNLICTTQNRKADCKIKANPELRSFWRKPNIRNRILYGGRSSTKSWDAAIRAILIAHNLKKKFLCTRQFQNKIEESVYTLIKNLINQMGLSSAFTITNNKITSKKTGSEFIFYGLWRHIEEIKSTEGIDILWIEESHALTPKQWEILEPTVRKEKSEVWIVFNPQISTDFVYQRFVINPPPDTITKKINYTENPFISDTALKIIEAKKTEDPDEYEHIYLGVPRDDDESVIIKRKWLNACVDAHLKLGFEPTGQRRIGFDIADDGGDRCCNVLAHGSVALEMDYWKANEDELMKSTKHTYSNAVQWQAHVTYDATGVGAMAGSKFKEINDDPSSNTRVTYDKFQAGGAVVHPDRKYADKIKNKDMFSNLKAQAWWLVADRLRNTWNAINNGMVFKPEEMISISSKIKDLEKLITELSTPKKDYDATGKVKVESKKDLDEREIPSPDLADAFVMAFAPKSGKKSMIDVFMAA